MRLAYCLASLKWAPGNLLELTLNTDDHKADTTLLPIDNHYVTPGGGGNHNVTPGGKRRQSLCHTWGRQQSLCNTWGKRGDNHYVTPGRGAAINMSHLGEAAITMALQMALHVRSTSRWLFRIEVMAAGVILTTSHSDCQMVSKTWVLALMHNMRAGV